MLAAACIVASAALCAPLIAQIRYEQGRVDEAIASLHAAIEADPQHPAAYDHLGTILVEQGGLDEAEANYRRLVHIRPSAAAHQKLAQVLMDLGRTDAAREEMARAKALERTPGEVR